jgi:thioredoxin-like negative regulator of GroEL
MNALSVAALLQVSLLSFGAESTYEEARRLAEETGQPMVVLVGADWCGACQAMERTVLPQLRERGLLGKVAFALVNLDRQREVGAQLTGNGPIPQLIMYRKAEDGWRRRRLIGSQTVETVEGFIDQGLKLNTAPKAVQTVPAATGAPTKTHLTAHASAAEAEHSATPTPAAQ